MSKMAYKSKGMKAPRPGAYGKPDPSAPPKVKPSMEHKEPSAEYQYPKMGEQSMQLDHKKMALPHKDAPEGVSDPNGGKDYPLPKSGGRGESEV